MMPTEGQDSLSIIDKLAAAFRSNNLNDKERVPKSSRSPRQNNSSTSPSLRKRSSGSLGHYRPIQEANETRRRDSNGLNYSNFVSALNEYQQQQQQQTPSLNLDTSEAPLLSFKRDESSPIKSSSPTIAPSPPSPRTNKGRVGKRLSATLSTIIHPTQTNPHGNNMSGGALAKTISETKYIEASELGEILEQALPMEPLMIDMRPLENYEKSRIRHSINVNVPSLLIKRYKRGVVSNFNLSSFITTPEGNEYYTRWMSKFNIQDNNIQNLPEGAKFIVYDDHMMNEDTTTAVWTLMAVIAKNLNVASNVNWLKHGYCAFEKWDFNAKYIVNFNHSPPLPIPLFKPTPMISRSATTLSSKNNQINVQRRASLFSLDTTTLRSKNPSTQRRISSINEKPCLFSPSTPATTTSPDVFHTPLEQFPTATTPKVDSEFDFVISEIIPNFLYLGPEIATSDQLGGLKSKSIKRILNMAEECDDDVPGLKEIFKYQKIDARDTVEMQNVEETLRKAVQVIGKYLKLMQGELIVKMYL